MALRALTDFTGYPSKVPTLGVEGRDENHLWIVKLERKVLGHSGKVCILGVNELVVAQG